MVSVVNNNDSDPAASSSSDDSDSGSSSESTASSDEEPHREEGAAAQEDEELLLKIQNLRSIIDPDHVMPLEELLDILDENERASARTATNTATTTASSTLSSERTSARTAGTSSSPSGGSNRWDRCQAPSSRPGVISVGGAITGRVVPVGELDEIELIEKKINAVHKVQARLQFSDLQSKKQEVERMYEEEKRMLEAATMGQTAEKAGPRLKTWDPPSDEMLRIEPTLPPPEPLPLSLIEEGMDSGVTNSQIAVGKLFDPGEDEEEKQEEDVSIANKYSEVTLDDSELGAYEHVVRCWKCRAGLKINIEIGLVACPRCRSISPTTDVTSVG